MEQEREDRCRDDVKHVVRKGYVDQHALSHLVCDERSEERLD